MTSECAIPGQLATEGVRQRHTAKARVAVDLEQYDASLNCYLLLQPNKDIHL